MYIIYCILYIVLYIIYSRDSSTDFTLKDCLFVAVKQTSNVDHDKYSYFRYGSGLDSRSLFLVSNLNFGKSTIISGVDNSYPTHTDNIKEDILVLAEGPTQRLDNTATTADANNSINLLHQKRSSWQWK